MPISRGAHFTIKRERSRIANLLRAKAQEGMFR